MGEIDLSKTTLYSVKQVCEKLGVSRSTLDRWRGISSFPTSKLAVGSKSLASGILGQLAQQQASFPKPDTYLNNSPRWTLQTLNNWVNSNKKTSLQPGSEEEDE